MNINDINLRSIAVTYCNLVPALHMTFIETHKVISNVLCVILGDTISVTLKHVMRVNFCQVFVYGGSSVKFTGQTVELIDHGS